MAENQSEFAALMKRLQMGDQSAAWTIIDIYGPHIQRVVRRDLNERLRSKFDSADFVQSVWASFFRQPNQFRKLEKPQDLLEFLVTVARNKVVDETRRRLQTQKMDVSREDPIDSDDPPDVDQLPSNDPRPSQVAVAREQWDRLLSEQPVKYQRILEMRFAGNTYEEIAAEVQLNERTVRKVVEQMLSEMEGG